MPTITPLPYFEHDLEARTRDHDREHDLAHLRLFEIRSRRLGAHESSRRLQELCDAHESENETRIQLAYATVEREVYR